MDKMWTRGWKQHEREERSRRSCLVSELLGWNTLYCAVNAPSSISKKDEHKSIYTGSLLFFFFFFSPQPLGSWAGWSGSSGPGATMNNSCRSARGNSWSTGTGRRRGGLLWRRSVSRDWRRRRWVLMAERSHFLWIQHWRLFPWMKERYESAVRKTIEKSQKATQGLSQNTRGRKTTKNSKQTWICFLFSAAFNIIFLNS